MARSMLPDSLKVSPEAVAIAPVARRRILVVDGDAGSAAELQLRLAQAGFGVTTLAHAERAPDAVAQFAPDLVILDWDMPGVVGVDIVRHIRSGGGRQSTRVIVFSRLAAEQQIVAGFEAGCDDYVVKPYSMPELMARVRALLRSREREDEAGELLRFQELQISGHDYRLTVHGAPVALRSSEYRLLEFLVRNPERAFSRAQLLDRVWGRDTQAEERAIDVTVQRLRKALARHGCAGYIQTVRSVGYRISSAIIEVRQEVFAGD
jgi:two-component system phosphate regulon response regulator PhoB